MAKLQNQKKIMIVSENESFFQNLKSILPPSDFFPVFHSKNGGEARRKLLELPVDILIIDSPLSDEHGVMFAQSFADQDMGILLLTSSETFDQVCSQVEEDGIVTLPKPMNPEMFYTGCRMLSAMVSRIHKMNEEKRSLQDKMQDIRIINKAKWVLIENRKMSESEAHKFIEKKAMDNRRSRRDVAEEIIDEYE